VRLEGQVGLPARPFDHAGEASGAERRSAFRGEHEGRLGFLLALKPPQRPQFIPEDRMGAWGSLLTPKTAQPSHLASMAAFKPEAYIGMKRKRSMPEDQANEERPCLHCMIVELIDQFFEDYAATSGEPDTIDTDEVITAVAKTVAELTCSQDGTARQQMIEQLMREIMDYDAEFRRDDASGVIGSGARH
jgi:hypothetical protein